MKHFFLFALLSLGLTACRQQPSELTPQMQGEILVLSQTGDQFGLYIEAGESSNFDITAASITLDQKTTILDLDGKKISFEKLSEGQWIEVEFEGELAESYPLQATAKAIQLIEKPETATNETDTDSEAEAVKEAK